MKLLILNLKILFCLFLLFIILLFLISSSKSIVRGVSFSKYDFFFDEQNSIDYKFDDSEKFYFPTSVATLSFQNYNLTIPIAQSNDNSYYLNHSLDGKKNELGNPFLDFRNHLEDRKILIYGHNSETVSTEFHFLEEYLNPMFLKNHSLIFLGIGEEETRYQIFSVIIVKDDFQHMKLDFNDEDYYTHLQWLKSNSVFDTGVLINGSDDILILQTCYYDPRDSYLLVVGKKVT